MAASADQCAPPSVVVSTRVWPAVLPISQPRLADTNVALDTATPSGGAALRDRVTRGDGVALVAVVVTVTIGAELLDRFAAERPEAPHPAIVTRRTAAAVTAAAPRMHTPSPHAGSVTPRHDTHSLIRSSVANLQQVRAPIGTRTSATHSRPSSACARAPSGEVGTAQDWVRDRHFVRLMDTWRSRVPQANDQRRIGPLICGPADLVSQGMALRDGWGGPKTSP